MASSERASTASDHDALTAASTDAVVVRFSEPSVAAATAVDAVTSDNVAGDNAAGEGAAQPPRTGASAAEPAAVDPTTPADVVVMMEEKASNGVEDVTEEGDWVDVPLPARISLSSPNVLAKIDGKDSSSLTTAGTHEELQRRETVILPSTLAATIPSSCYGTHTATFTYTHSFLPGVNGSGVSSASGVSTLRDLTLRPIAEMTPSRFLPNRPWFLLPFSILVPCVLTVLLFGVIPLGQANTSTSQKSVYLLLTSPGTYVAFGALMVILFYAVLDENMPWRPVRTYIPILLGQYVLQVGVMYIIYPQTNTFPLMGLVPFVLAIGITIVGLHYMRSMIWTCGCSYYPDRLREYRAVILGIAVFIVVLSGWAMVYRSVSTEGQVILPFLLLFIVFFFKKYLLSRSDRFPLEICMLISGLWLENLDDVFQTIVFPVVVDPGPGYVALAARKLIENLAYLCFLTDRWFRFRVWIKDRLKRVFIKKYRHEPHAQPIEDDVNLNDRGHSNQKPGYHRRQVQFFMYKIFSQIAAAIFYLCVAPVMRFGTNADFFPMSEVGSVAADVTKLTGRLFRNSMLFAGWLVVSSVIAGIVGRWYIRKKHVPVYDQLMQLYGTIFYSPIYFGFVIVILMSNQLLAVAVVLYHNRIWFFSEHCAPGSSIDCANH